MNASIVMFVNLCAPMKPFSWGNWFMKSIQTYAQSVSDIMINPSVNCFVQWIVFRWILIMRKLRMSSWINIKSWLLKKAQAIKSKIWYYAPRSEPDDRCCGDLRDWSRGGKSGLHRARCQVTPGRREPTESAAESRPPSLWFRAIEIGGKGERVR